MLSWSGPCYDGGSAVLGYVVEVKNQGRVESGDWRELTAQCKSTSYRVCSGLQHQQEYCFRVSAYNEVGISEPGPVSPVVRMEQKGEVTWVYDTTFENRGKYNTCITAIVSLCADLDKPQKEEAPQAYTCVTIDSSNKVTDHYYLQEKLGV